MTLRGWLWVMVVGAAFGAGVAVQADIIELKGGKRIAGTMTRQGDGMVIKGEDGTVTRVAPEDVLKVTLTSNVSPAEAATAEWTRLAAQIKNADDVATIIGLHQKFLARYPEAKQAEEVKGSLRVYEQLAEAKAVKFRGRWMPREQVEVAIKQWAEAAAPAAELYRAGRMKEALEAARKVIAADEANPNALGVAGLAAWRMNNFPLAKGYFAQMLAADPSSVLAANNLGVLAFMLKNPAEGLVHYTKAVQARPDHRLVLDNIAEALNTYVAGGGDKRSGAYVGLMKAFEPAERAMEAQLGGQGLQRWGSTWVTKGDKEKLLALQNQVKDQAATLDGQYRSARDQLAGMDGQIQQAATDFDAARLNVDYWSNQITLQSVRGWDVTAAVMSRDQAIGAMNAAQQRKAALEGQRDQLRTTIATLEGQAGKIKGAVERGTSLYTGVQRMMDLGDVEKAPEPSPVQLPAADGGGAQPVTVVLPQPVVPTPNIVTPVPVPQGLVVIQPEHPYRPQPATRPAAPETQPGTMPGF